MRSMRSRTNWLARLVRGRRLDRNPLRRGSDRAETVVFCALLAGFLAAAPFTMHTAGSWTYATSAREAQAQRATLRQVPATLTQTSPHTAADPGAGGAFLSVGARWRAPDGQERTGELVVAYGTDAGSTVPVWVDQAGRLADPPLSRVQLVILDRHRMAAWDADWRATGSRWSPRH